MNKIGLAITFVIVVSILTGAIHVFIHSSGPAITTVTSSNPTSTVTTASNGNPSISDGTLTFNYSSTDFALATTQDQILTHSYIPPCDPSFNYCLYYIAPTYQGTNFESAGVRIEKRADLTTQTTCLTTPPTGYTNFTPTSTTSGDYSLSEFSPIGGAGAGHYAAGTLYRLSYNGICYEFETRIGQAQYANYPSGSIQQFTTTKQSDLQAKIMNILDNMTLPSGEKIVFPA
jgi:hypothetical protein